MVKYIEFGEYNKNYNFIILAVIFWILFYSLDNFLIILLFKYEIISVKVIYLYSHRNIITVIYLFNMFIFSCILNIYASKLSKIKPSIDESNSSNLDKGCYNDIQINEDKKKEKLNNKKNLLNILFIIIFSIILQNLAGIIKLLKIFNIWMIILLITSFINTKMFKIKIYKHQKCAIIFNFSVFFILELASFILSMVSKND